MKPLNLLLVGGTGKVGRALIPHIANQDSWKSKIRKCHIVSRDIEKAETIVDAAGNHIIDFIPESIDNIEGIDARIALILSDVNNEYIRVCERKKIPPDRKYLCEQNVPLVIELISKLTQRERAVGIVTNSPVTLPAIAAHYWASDKFNPNLIFGVSHVDTIRARKKVEDILTEHGLFLMNPPSLFVIGGHDTGEIIPAFCSAKIGDVPFDSISFLKGHYDEVKEHIEKFGGRQMVRFGDTNIDTIESIIHTINAIIDEKTVACVSRFCDFESSYFKDDPDYAKLVRSVYSRKNPKPTFQVLPSVFNGLKTEFHDPCWFKELDFSTKHFFYETARNHSERIDEIIRSAEKAPKRKSIVSIKEAKMRRPAEIFFNVANLENVKVFAAAGRKVWRYEDNPVGFNYYVKRIGEVNGERYIAFVRGFALLNENLEEKKHFTYSIRRGRGPNKVIKHEGNYYVSDSEAGILKNDNVFLIPIFEGKTKAVNVYNDEIIFINNNNCVMNLEDTIIYYSENKLVDVLASDSGMIVPDESGAVHFQTSRNKWEIIDLEAKIRCACLFDADGKEYAALGTDKGAYLVDLETKEASHIYSQGKVNAIAGKKGNLFISQETFLKNLTNPAYEACNLESKIMSICF